MPTLHGACAVATATVLTMSDRCSRNSCKQRAKCMLLVIRSYGDVLGKSLFFGWFSRSNLETYPLKECHVLEFLRQDEIIKTLQKSNDQLMKIIERPLIKFLRKLTCLGVRSRQCSSLHSFYNSKLFDNQQHGTCA
ncbi:hypothetical protein TNCV_3386141 [Trichonephila clavipes]|nr:hypothetical protein TNCV_3386141 [Trichonephila clavipes]